MRSVSVSVRVACRAAALPLAGTARRAGGGAPCRRRVDELPSIAERLALARPRPLLHLPFLRPARHLRVAVLVLSRLGRLG